MHGFHDSGLHWFTFSIRNHDRRWDHRTQPFSHSPRFCHTNSWRFQNRGEDVIEEDNGPESEMITRNLEEGPCRSFNRRGSSPSYLPFCSATASCNRFRSCATCTTVVTVRAEIVDKMSPPIAPKAGVNGHAYSRAHLLNLRESISWELTCQGLSQSRAMGITPIQHPRTVPIAGKTMARSTKFRVLHEVRKKKKIDSWRNQTYESSAKSLIQVQRLAIDVELFSSVGIPKTRAGV